MGSVWEVRELEVGNVFKGNSSSGGGASGLQELLRWRSSWENGLAREHNRFEARVAEVRE